MAAHPVSSSAGTAQKSRDRLAGAGCFRCSHKASVDLWSALTYVCVLPPLAVCIVLNATTCHRLPGLSSVTTLLSALAFPCQKNLLGKIWYLFRNCRQVIIDTFTYGTWYAYPHAGSAVWLVHLAWLVAMLTTSAQSYERRRRAWLLAIRLGLIVPWTVGLVADLVPIGALAATALLQVPLRGDHVSVIWEVYETLAYRLPIKDQILVMSWDALLSITSWILVQPRLPCLQQLAPVIIAPTLLHLIFQKLLSVALTIPLTLALDRTNHQSFGTIHTSRTAKSRHDSMGGSVALEGQGAVSAASLASQPGSSMQSVSHTTDICHTASGSHPAHVSHTARHAKQDTDKPAGATSVVPHLDKDTHGLPLGLPLVTRGPQNAHVTTPFPELPVSMHHFPAKQQVQPSGSELDLSTAIYPSRTSAIVSIKIEPPPHMVGNFPQLLAAAELAQAQATADIVMQHEDTDVLSSSQVHIIRGCIQLVAIVERPEGMSDDHFQQLLADYQQRLQCRLLQSLQGSTLLDSSTIDAQSRQADGNAPGWYALCIPPVPSVPPPAGAYTGNLAVAGLPISKGGAETSMPRSIADILIWSPQQYAGREELPSVAAAGGGMPHADSAAVPPVHLPAVVMSHTAAARSHADLDTVQPSDVDTALFSGSATAVQTAGTAAVQHADTAAVPSPGADGAAEGSTEAVAHGPVAAMSDAQVSPPLCRIVVKQGHAVLYDKELPVSHTGRPLQVWVSGLQQGAATFFVLPPSSPSVQPPTYSADIYLHAPFMVVPATVAAEMNRLFQQMIQAAESEDTAGSDVQLQLPETSLTATADESDAQGVATATGQAGQPTLLEAKVWTNHMSPLCADISSILELSRTVGQYAATAPADMAAVSTSLGAMSHATAATASSPSVSTASLSAAASPASIGTTASGRSSTAATATAATSLASRIDAATYSSATRQLQSKAPKVLSFLQRHGMSDTIGYIVDQLCSAGIDIIGSELITISPAEPSGGPPSADRFTYGMAENEPHSSMIDSHKSLEAYNGSSSAGHGQGTRDAGSPVTRSSSSRLNKSAGMPASGSRPMGISAKGETADGVYTSGQASASSFHSASFFIVTRPSTVVQTGRGSTTVVPAPESADRLGTSEYTDELTATLKHAIKATLRGQFADPQIQMQYQQISTDRYRVADTSACIIWSMALFLYVITQPVQALPLVVLLSCTYIVPSIMWLQPSFQPQVLRRYIHSRHQMQFLAGVLSASVRVLAGLGALEVPASGIGAYSVFYTFVDPCIRQYIWRHSALSIVICYIAWYLFYRRCVPHSDAKLRALLNMAVFALMLFSLETWWRWRLLLKLRQQQRIGRRRVMGAKFE